MYSDADATLVAPTIGLVQGAYGAAAEATGILPSRAVGAGRCLCSGGAGNQAEAEGDQAPHKHQRDPGPPVQCSSHMSPSLELPSGTSPEIERGCNHRPRLSPAVCIGTLM